MNDVITDCALFATNAVVATLVLLSPTDCVVAVVPLGSTIVEEHAATAPAEPLPHSGAVVAADGIAVANCVADTVPDRAETAGKRAAATVPLAMADPDTAPTLMVPPVLVMVLPSTVSSRLSLPCAAVPAVVP